MDNNNYAMPSSSKLRLNEEKHIEQQQHHLKAAICTNRAKYRQGRKDTAVKVYTISQESYYILVQNVPSIDISEELRTLCETFGKVEIFVIIPDYPREDFTEVYLVKYQKLQEARVSKKQLDDRSFFGGNLHVCYAPECESVQETRCKLNERNRIVASRMKMIKNPGTIQNFGQKSIDTLNTSQLIKNTIQQPSCLETVESLPSTSGVANMIGPRQLDLDIPNIVKDSDKNNKSSDSETIANSNETTTFIWAGKEYPIQSDAAAINHLNVLLPKKKVVYKTTGRNLVPRQIAIESKSYTATRKRIFDKLQAITPTNPEVKLRKKS